MLRLVYLASVSAIIASSPAAAQSPTRDIKSKIERLVEPITGQQDDRLKLVATFQEQLTGVTVSETGRIFVNFPRWSTDAPISVAEVMSDGTIRAYPNDSWNAWRNEKMSELSVTDHFVCVQSVVADGRGSLWVVDAGAPNSEKVVKGAPKLVKIDLANNTVSKTIALSNDVAGPASYMNDLRVSNDGKFGFLTDSGSPGGLAIVDLEAGKAWRALSDDPSTQFEKDVTVMTDGKALRRPDGRQPMFNADGIALSTDGATLFFQALTGKTLYRVPTASLTSPEAAQSAKAEKVAETEPVDGLWIDKADRLYLSVIGSNAVKRRDKDGITTELLRDSRLRWPDTFSEGPDGAIYVTASHIMDSPWFHTTGRTNRSFSLFKFDPAFK